MKPEDMKKIRIKAGFATQKDFAPELDRSERWVNSRESGSVPIDRLEEHALKNIRRETAEKRGAKNNKNKR